VMTRTVAITLKKFTLNMIIKTLKMVWRPAGPPYA